MLRTTKQIQGRALHASDGDIGEVKDVYFDDHHWHVRYVVVETGSWLNKRDVLISPEAFSGFDWEAKAFPVNLTRAQVRNSPSIDTDKPVSRQHEETLRQYYGWPPYWGAMYAEGAVVPPLATPIPAGNTSEPGLTDGNAPLRRKGDPFLRSARDTMNYAIAAQDGDVGHVEDFLFDDRAWRVRYLIVDPRNWLPGRKVLVSPDWIRDVSWERSSVQVDLTRAAIKDSPDYDPKAPWTPTYSAELHDYYGRPRYSDWDKDITAGAPKLERKR